MNMREFQILLIDDDEDDYIYLRDLFGELTRTQYMLAWCPTYAEGLAALQETSYDACLLDYRLGANTGLDLLKEIHKLGLTCPTILLTGHGDFDLDLQAMQTGASDYLVKGQLTAPLLERSIRYSMKHAFDMQELTESKAQIMQQDRLASLGLLASSLAHEIGTPMGVIRSRAELVEKRVASGAVVDAARLKQDMDTIVTQIDRVSKLVNSLLHLARERKSEFAAAVNLGGVIEDVLNLVKHELEQKNILLDLKVDKEYIVKAEPGPLGQVLLNLLVNSIHAIEEEKSHGQKKSHKILLEVSETEGAVAIAVEDTGCGIPKENLTKIFRPFFTTKELGRGTGLGLATSFKLIQSWGGSIKAVPGANGGARFQIDIPKYEITT